MPPAFFIFEGLISLHRGKSSNFPAKIRHMKAFVFQTYGNPEKVLVQQEVPMPTPAANEVLVKIEATCINDYDYSMVTGKPVLYRLMYGWQRPKKKYQMPGMELAGTVIKAGQGCTVFKVGDRVMGDISVHRFGTFATHICVPESAVKPMPDSWTFEEAVVLPHAGMLAHQGLDGVACLKPGSKLLVNGAGGGVGFFAALLSRQNGIELTGVDTKDKQAWMKQAGYSHTLDYAQTDFTRTGERYHFILDCKTDRNPTRYLRALHKNGTYVTVGGAPTKLIRLLLGKIWIEMFSTKRLRLVVLKPNYNLEMLLSKVTRKSIAPCIEGPYRFEEIPSAMQHFGLAKHKGKMVISMQHDSRSTGNN